MPTANIPRSPQGKTRAAQNARKHRFTSAAAPSAKNDQTNPPSTPNLKETLGFPLLKRTHHSHSAREPIQC
jgi:hypothetical protein